MPPRTKAPAITQAEFDYATAYRADEEEWRTEGLGAIAANAHSRKASTVAGEVVRLMCEMTGNEVRRYDDGVIVVNHNFPSTEGMTKRQRVATRFTKILVGLVGESHKTVYTPIPDAELSAQALEHYRAINDRYSDIHFRRRTRLPIRRSRPSHS